MLNITALKATIRQNVWIFIKTTYKALYTYVFVLGFLSGCETDKGVLIDTPAIAEPETKVVEPAPEVVNTTPKIVNGVVDPIVNLTDPTTHRFKLDNYKIQNTHGLTWYLSFDNYVQSVDYDDNYIYVAKQAGSCTMVIKFEVSAGTAINANHICLVTCTSPITAHLGSGATDTNNLVCPGTPYQSALPFALTLSDNTATLTLTFHIGSSTTTEYYSRRP